MRVKHQSPHLGRGLCAAMLVFIPSFAAASPAAADVASLLSSVWAPATAYGLAMLALYSKGRK
jgi:hypothetical protein